jgi:hypothetical protein
MTLKRGNAPKAVRRRSSAGAIEETELARVIRERDDALDSGSLAKVAAIRRASSRVSRAWLKTSNEPFWGRHLSFTYRHAAWLTVMGPQLRTDADPGLDPRKAH